MRKTYRELCESVHHHLHASSPTSSDWDLYTDVQTCLKGTRSEAIENLTQLRNKTTDKEWKARYNDLLRQLKSTTE